MSFQPIDRTPLQGAAPALASGATNVPSGKAAAELALSSAGLAGADPKALAVAGTVLNTAAALESGAGASALMGGAAALGAKSDPKVARAMQIAFVGGGAAAMGAEAGMYLLEARPQLSAPGLGDYLSRVSIYIPSSPAVSFGSIAALRAHLDRKAGASDAAGS